MITNEGLGTELAWDIYSKLKLHLWVRLSLNLHECENEKIINEIFDPRSSHLSCRPLPSGLRGVYGDEPQVPVYPPSVSVAGCLILSCLLTGEDSALRSRVQQQQPCVLCSPVSGLVWSSWNLRQEATII